MSNPPAATTTTTTTAPTPAATTATTTATAPAVATTTTTTNAPSSPTAPTTAVKTKTAPAPVATATTAAPAAATTAATAAPASPTQPVAEAPRSDDPVIADLQKEHTTLQGEVKTLEKQADEAEKEAQKESLTSGTVKQKVRELSDQVTAAQRVKASLKKENDELLAALEHGKANVDLNARSANSKSLIAQYEEELSQKEEDDAQSKVLLEKMAAQYKRVAERKRTVMIQIKEELTSLEKALRLNAENVALKVKPPAAGPGEQVQQAADEEEDPAEQLDVLQDLASSREADLRDAERHLREAVAISALKADEIVRLEAETQQRLAERRKERDEEIKKMVYGFQDDRKALQDDIAEMRRANADQKVKLVRGHVQKVPHSNGDPTEVFLTSATREKGSPRDRTSRRETILKPKTKKTVEEVHLEEHNSEIEDQIRAALQQLSAEQQLKSEIQKNIKNKTEQMKKDELTFSQRIMQLQAAASSENALAIKASHENDRLCADVKHFSEVLENTRRNIERVRGHTLQLPCEE